MNSSNPFNKQQLNERFFVRINYEGTGFICDKPNSFQQFIQILKEHIHETQLHQLNISSSSSSILSDCSLISDSDISIIVDCGIVGAHSYRLLRDGDHCQCIYKTNNNQQQKQKQIHNSSSNKSQQSISNSSAQLPSTSLNTSSHNRKRPAEFADEHVTTEVNINNNQQQSLNESINQSINSRKRFIRQNDDDDDDDDSSETSEEETKEKLQEKKSVIIAPNPGRKKQRQVRSKSSNYLLLCF